jgi:hypothetical protein
MVPIYAITQMRNVFAGMDVRLILANPHGAIGFQVQIVGRLLTEKWPTTFCVKLKRLELKQNNPKPKQGEQK